MHKSNIFLMILLTTLLVLFNSDGKFDIKNYKNDKLNKNDVTEIIQEEEIVPQVNYVFENYTYDDLVSKIESHLNSTISGYGYLFVDKSLEYGIDPFLATAIVLHETGCKWDCSFLVKKCNNVGGQKGYPSCGGGEYGSFPTLEDGIKGYFSNLFNNYYQYGLNTVSLIGTKYVGGDSTHWVNAVNNYIEEIRYN